MLRPNCARILALIMTCLVLGTVISAPNHRDNNENMSECRTVTDCEGCNRMQNCVFSDNSCVKYDSTSQNALRNTEISLDTSSQYCHNSLGEDYINLNENGDNLSLFAYENATLSSYPYCEWSILTDANMNVEIIVSKTTDQSVRLYMYTNSPNSQRFYYEKDFSDCEDEDQSFYVTGSSYVLIKAEMLSDDSNYLIHISQSAKISESEESYHRLIIIVLSITLFTLLVSIIVCALFAVKIIRMRKSLRTGVERTFTNQRTVIIEKCMKAMPHGKFSDLDILYDQRSCTVCFEEFASNSQVSMTNECYHVFHTKCVGEWLKSIRLFNNLTCPHCLTVILNPNTAEVDRSNNYIDSQTILPRIRQELRQRPNNLMSSGTGYVGINDSSPNQIATGENIINQSLVYLDAFGSNRRSLDWRS